MRNTWLWPRVRLVIVMRMEARQRFDAGADMVGDTLTYLRDADGAGASKASSVLRCLRADIVAGQLQPGQKLSFKLLVRR